MIDFSQIEKHSKFYDLAKWFVRFTHNVMFYRKLEVNQKKNIPPMGKPVMMLSNHQNALMDALGVLFSLPEYYQPVFMARADIFKKDGVAKILRWLRILPVFRKRDGVDLGENDIVFKKAASLVSEGFPVCLFPEAELQSGHYLSSIKKGFARIAFDTAQINNFPEDMIIVPVGNHYEDYWHIRQRVCMTYGDAIRIADYYDEYKENPAKALHHLSTDVGAAFEKIVLNIDDRENYESWIFMIEALQEKNAREKGLKKHGMYREYKLSDLLQTDMQCWANIKERTLAFPEKKTECLNTISSYRTLLKKYKISHREISRIPTFLGLLKHALWLLLLLPIWLYGAILNFIPLRLMERLVKKKVSKMPSDHFESSFLFVLNCIVLSPIFSIIYVIIFACIFPKIWAIVLFWISLPVCKNISREYEFSFGRFLKKGSALLHKQKIKAELLPLYRKLESYV